LVGRHWRGDVKNSSSKMDPRESISALADGQLHGEAFAHAASLATTDPQAQDAWTTYHLIGEVLRTGQATTGSSPQAFLDKLSRQLALEEPLRPQAGISPEPSDPTSTQVSMKERPAANDGSFRWKLVAGFASVAAVAAVSWTLVGGAVGTGGASQQPQLASLPTQPADASVAGATVVAGDRGVMIRDPRLDEFLAAHRQFGGASALQMPAGFLRNATSEGPSR
jgi:sigma-E factor negative regulatory protein RseA